MKKILLLVALFLICSSIVSADIQVKGYIYLTIKNDPPEVVSIFFTNEEVYEDSTIGCDATVIDEAPNNVKLKYTWYVNDNELSFYDKALPSSFFKAQDVVTCKIVPNDYAQDGIPKSVSVTVQPIPVGTKFAQGVLNLAGVSTNAEQISSIRKEQGMMGVTGFVVKELGNQSKGLAIPGLIFFLTIVLLITVNLVVRSTVRKQKAF